MNKQTLDTFEALVEQAEAVKASKADNANAKAAKVGDAFLKALAAEDVDTHAVENIDTAALTQAVEALRSVAGVSLADEAREQGSALASRLAKVLALDPEDRPSTFNAERGTALLTRWNASTRRGRGPGSGGGGEGADAVGFPVTITFTYPEGADVDLSDSITHNSTWSSLSNEITKRAKAVSGREWGHREYKRPQSAADAWKAAVKALRDGESGPFTFDVDTEGGTLGVSITR